jgi:hypothetical protein
LLILVTKTPCAGAADGAKTWQDRLLAVPYAAATHPDHMMLELVRQDYAMYPFSFTYGGKSSDGLLPAWTREEHSIRLDADRTRLTTVWTDAKSGLKMHWDAVRYADFPAVEWVLHFENAGIADTPLIENVRAMDLTLSAPLGSVAPYILHSAKGGVPNPSQSMPKTCVIDEKNPATLGSETGRSSTKNLPFFRLDAGGETLVAAIGWSGCWRADFVSSDGKRLHVRYKEVRHLLVGAWYPLLPCPNDYVDLNTRDVDLWLWGGGDVSKHRKPYTEWVATQYHRPDFNEGMVLAFRRPDSPYSSIQVSLRGIDPTATYEVSWDSKGRKDNKRLPGWKLVRGFEIVLPEKRSSDLIVYHKAAMSAPRDAARRGEQ